MVTEYFLKRPVVTMTLMVVVCVAGFLSFSKLPFRLFPHVPLQDVQVNAIYPGASAQQMRARITSVLEEQINDIESVSYISSVTRHGFASITAHVEIGGDYKHAFSTILEKVKSARGLPQDLDPPEVRLEQPERAPDMAIAFFSEQMQREQVTEFLTRVIKPELESLEGISAAEVLGSKYALRIWLNPHLMKVHNIDADQIIRALNQQNIYATTGQLQNNSIHVNIETDTSIQNIEEYGDIAVRYDETGEIKLSDIATVEMGTHNEHLVSLYNGVPSTVVTAKLNPYANPLSVIDEIKQLMATQKDTFPYDLKAEVIVDSSEYIRGALIEVGITIVIAVGIVFLVLFLFTGTINSVIIPLVTIPLSQLGIFTILALLGYSLNTLTLLALVLAIGIVVDDAIIVYDNILAKFESGKMRLKQAVSEGAAEMIKPVIAITLTFVTVYIPIMFVGGVIENLFTEFAVTLAGSVLISGVIALVLTPLMCRWLIVSRDRKTRFSDWVSSGFERLKKSYASTVKLSTRWYGLGVLLWLGNCLLVVYLFSATPKELVAKEDQGMIMVLGSVSSYKSTEFINQYNSDFLDVFDSIDAVSNYNYITGIPAYNQLISYVRLKHWDDRTETAQQVQQQLRYRLAEVAGVRTVPILPSYLPGTSGLPFQIVIKHRNSDYQALDTLTNQILAGLRQTGDFEFIIRDLNYDTPYRDLKIDRQLAKSMGVDVDEVARTLSLFYADRYIQQVDYQNKSYDVIVKVEPQFMNDIDKLKDTVVRNNNNELIPLSSFVDFDYQILPNSLNTFQKQGAVVLSGNLNPHVKISDALERAARIVEQVHPTDISMDYAGETRQFMQENQNSFFMLLITIMIIFLFLILLYGKVVDSLVIILGSIPLAATGSLLYINLSGQTLNIFTHIAILTLVGLITKHGILMVRKAESLIRIEQLNLIDAINQASVQRFRAILMTTISMVVGALPLYFATGPGAVSREQIGGVIIWGMAFGTIFTLYVLPSLYIVLNHIKNRFFLPTQRSQTDVVFERH
ncbi:efflux RND transporter permease subunit [Marinicella sp. W31]|uniref:efflux RND transporter permease subunit n=1 Tax=Marinicella sp. W31 TaxID=3023713 RepID=UPI0037571E80